MLKMFKDKLAGNQNRLSGRTDLLEAICAASALVAAADGSIDDSEIDGAVQSVTANEALAANFSSGEIERVLDTMFDRASKGRVGRRSLMKEIEDIKANDDEREIVMMTALDIAEADGNIDDKEQKMLEDIAKSLSLRLEAFL